MKPSLTSIKEHSGRRGIRSQRARFQHRRRQRATPQVHVERLEDRALLSVDPGFVFGIQPISGALGRTRVSLDPAGDIYATGSFYGTVDFDPSGPNQAATFTAGSTSSDAYAARYSPSGGFLWARHLKGASSSSAVGWSIAVFQDPVSGAQSIYVSGAFNGPVDFSGTGSGANYTGAVGGVFVEKLDASGSLQWVNVSLGGPNSGDVYGVTVDASGTPYVAGDWNNFASPTSSDDIFAAKLDPTTGQTHWVQGFGSSGIDIAYGIAVGQDPTNNGQLTAHITGRFQKTVSLGTQTFTAQNSDIFIAKLDASGGQTVGAWQVVGTGANTGHAITVDPAGNIYSAGYFAGTADFDPGTGTHNLTSLGFARGGLDSYVLKLDPAGNFLWARQMGGAGGSITARKIALDASGAVYTVGTLSGTVDFDIGHTNFSATGGGFLAKFDSSGNFLAAWGIAGTSRGVAPYLDPITGKQSVIVGGLFSGTAVFPTGTTVTLGSRSAYIMKLNQLPTITGILFNDLNNNGMNDEVSPLQGLTIFLDQNQNGVLDPGEPVTTTNALGAYSFPNLAPGTYSVAQVIASGYSQTAPLTGQPNTYAGTSNGQIGRAVTAVAGQFSAGNDVGNFTPNQVKTYSSTNVPLKIQDLMTTTSKLTMNDSYTIFDVNVTLNIAQPVDSDLKVTLTGPDGTSVLLFQGLGASGSNFTNTTLDDAPTLLERSVVTAATGDIRALAYSSDGALLAAASARGEITLWDAGTHQKPVSLGNSGQTITELAFAPKSDLIAAASSDGTVRVWDLVSGRERSVLRGHRASVLHVAFSPNGQLLASVGDVDQTVRLWDVARGREQGLLRRRTSGIIAIAFSPDGQTLAGGGEDGTIVLFDLASGRERLSLHGHTGWDCALAFTPDGKTLVSGGTDATVRVWDVPE